jgi:basic membrane lipoprotein Med (substrate-binding protein (PBP1-ABC) superfamily)
MDLNTWLSLAITLLFTAVAGIISAYVKGVRDDLKDSQVKHEALQKAHTEFRIEVAGEYMKKADMQSMLAEFKQDMKALIEQVRADIRDNVERIEAQVRK